MKAVRKLLEHRFTYAAVENAYLDGRIPYPVFDQWVKLWTWAAPHFGGIAADVQDAFCRQRGYQAYIARINRVRRVLGASVVGNPVELPLAKQRRSPIQGEMCS